MKKIVSAFTQVVSIAFRVFSMAICYIIHWKHQDTCDYDGIKEEPESVKYIS